MDKFKDQDSSLPAATDDKKKAIVAKTGGKTQIIINPPEKVDPQRGYNEQFKQSLQKHSVIIEKKTELVLQSKAARAEIPQETLEQVFKRGYKSLPLNSQLTREQYAMNRVNSFVAGGAAMVEDCDLLPIMERIGIKGTGGGARPHIKREKSVYNGRTMYHVVDAKGRVKHSTSDEFEAKKHLATKYNSYMESTLSPMKRFEGTKSLVKTYKDDTPGEGKKEVTEAEKNPHREQGVAEGSLEEDEYDKMLRDLLKARPDLTKKYAKDVQKSKDIESGKELNKLVKKNPGVLKTYSDAVKRDKKLGVAEAKDPGEYDQEGKMAKGQLRTIIANAQRAHDMLEDNTNMAEWVQSKITLASDYISTVADYIQSELKEGKMSDLDIDMQTMKDKDFETHYGKPKHEYKPKLKGNRTKLDKNHNGKLDAEDFKLLRQEEVKKGLYYYVNRRKKLGISRDKDSEKAPSAQDWKNAAKTAKEEVDLSELSNAVLARYKQKAGEQASAADKAGNFKKGNKRFSGIIKATNKQFDNDAKGAK